LFLICSRIDQLDFIVSVAKKDINHF